MLAKVATMAMQAGMTVNRTPEASQQLVSALLRTPGVTRRALQCIASDFHVTEWTAKRLALLTYATAGFLYNWLVKQALHKCCDDIEAQGGESLILQVGVRPDETPMKLCAVDLDAHRQTIADWDDGNESDSDDEQLLQAARDSAATKLLNSIWTLTALYHVRHRYIALRFLVCVLRCPIGGNLLFFH